MYFKNRIILLCEGKNAIEFEIDFSTVRIRHKNKMWVVNSSIHCSD